VLWPVTDSFLVFLSEKREKCGVALREEKDAVA
jgi:hypothetical protein